jgi:hypothetical protein
VNPFTSIFNVNANTDAYLAELFYEDMTIDLSTINVPNWSDFLFARSGYENLLYSDSSQIHGMYAATGTNQFEDTRHSLIIHPCSFCVSVVCSR